MSFLCPDITDGFSRKRKPDRQTLRRSLLKQYFEDDETSTHRKRTMPVLDMAYERPRIPLPMMALLRLKMDIPNEVFPSN